MPHSCSRRHTQYFKDEVAIKVIRQTNEESDLRCVCACVREYVIECVNMCVCARQQRLQERVRDAVRAVVRLLCAGKSMCARCDARVIFAQFHGATLAPFGTAHSARARSLTPTLTVCHAVCLVMEYCCGGTLYSVLRIASLDLHWSIALRWLHGTLVRLVWWQRA
jgi:hypothetical protein